MSRRKFTFDTVLGKREAEVRVTYSCTPFVPATYWQPAEGGEVEIVRVEQNGKAVFLSQDEEDLLLNEAQGRAAQDWDDERAAQADYLYEQYRDRLGEDS